MSSPRTATACAIVADGTTVEARHAILAVPPVLAARLAYSPALPKGKAALLKALVPGTPDQGRGRLRPPVLARRRAQRPGRRPTSGRANTIFDNSPPDGSLGVLFGFVGGSAHAPWAKLPADQRRAQVLENLAAFVGDQARAPADYFEQDWTKERWTRGCPVAHAGPGRADEVRAMAAPCRRQGPLRRHRDLRLLAGVHGRRRALRRARRPGGPRGAAALTPGVRLLRDSFPEAPALDIAVSHALLMRVARGEVEPTVRLYRPAPTLAFGRLDALRPGFAEAGAAARDAGFEPIVRLAGGHAAAYHEQSLIYEEIVAQPRRDRRPARPLPRRRRPAGRSPRRASASRPTSVRSPASTAPAPTR